MIDSISVTQHLSGKITKLAYSVEETSELTSLSKAFLRLEIKRGKLKVTRFGRRVLVLLEDLRDYLNNGSSGKKVGLTS